MFAGTPELIARLSAASAFCAAVISRPSSVCAATAELSAATPLALSWPEAFSCWAVLMFAPSEVLALCALVISVVSCAAVSPAFCDPGTPQSTLKTFCFASPMPVSTNSLYCPLARVFVVVLHSPLLPRAGPQLPVMTVIPFGQLSMCQVPD